MTDFPEVVDSTLLAAARACGAKANMAYFEHWKPSAISVHLHAGKAYAEGLERARKSFWEGGFSTPDAIAHGAHALIESYGDYTPPEDSAKRLDRMLGALEFHFERYPLGADGTEPIVMATGSRAIEFSGASPLPIMHPTTGNPILYSWRADAIVKFADGVWVQDDKTSTSLGSYWQTQWDLRSQFTAYCLLPETEVLTRQGWKQLKDLQKEEEIVQSTASGTMTWAIPSEIHSPNFDGNLISCQGKVSFVSTPDHRQTVYDTYSHKDKEYTSLGLPKRSGALRFRSAGHLEGGEDLSSSLIKFIVAIQADGSWKDGGVRFHFSKDRKAFRLEEILDDLGISVSWHKTSDWSIQIPACAPVQTAFRLLGQNKLFGAWLLDFSQETLQTFIKELAFWDGTKYDTNWLYFSNSEENVDWARTIAALTGHYSSKHSIEGYKSKNKQYRTIITDGCLHSPHLHTWNEQSYTGKVYCVTVPASHFLIRYQGRTMITGNCWGAASQGVKVTGVLVRGVSILKTKYDTLQHTTYRPQWMIDRWLGQTCRDLEGLIVQWKSGVWNYNLDDACTAYGGCQFRQVCMSEDPKPWLEMSFTRRRWDPLTRIETPL